MAYDNKKKYTLYTIIAVISIAIPIFLYSKNIVKQNPHYIPEIEINPESDMQNTIIYKGRIYIETSMYQFDDISKSKNLLSSFIGSVKPSIDEYTLSKSTETYLASSFWGYIYTVNGYSEDFRLCSYDEENNIVTFYENLYGITIKNGWDLFDERLKFDKFFPGKSENIYLQVNELRYNSLLEFNDQDIKMLYNTLIEAEQILYTRIRQNLEKVCTICFQMDNETVVEINFYNDNYISYQNIYFKVKGSMYDRITDLAIL